MTVLPVAITSLRRREHACGMFHVEQFGLDFLNTHAIDPHSLRSNCFT